MALRFMLYFLSLLQQATTFDLLRQFVVQLYFLSLLQQATTECLTLYAGTALRKRVSV